MGRIALSKVIQAHFLDSRAASYPACQVLEPSVANLPKPWNVCAPLHKSEIPIIDVPYARSARA